MDDKLELIPDSDREKIIKILKKCGIDLNNKHDVRYAIDKINSKMFLLSDDRCKDFSSRYDYICNNYSIEELKVYLIDKHREHMKVIWVDEINFLTFMEKLKLIYPQMYDKVKHLSANEIVDSKTLPKYFIDELAKTCNINKKDHITARDILAKARRNQDNLRDDLKKLRKWCNHLYMCSPHDMSRGIYEYIYNTYDSKGITFYLDRIEIIEQLIV